jgi:DNA-binding LacI/PurR family transcriptional regulator
VKSGQNVTMREVARAAGVAVSTVSKALRNDPSLPAARCRSVQAAAVRLGYRPHPLVAALMAQLHHRRRRADPQSLAWIDLWPSGSVRSPAMSPAPLLRGAQARAQELGYEIAVYPVGTDGVTPDRLHRMLTARGQWGLIIPPVPESAMRFPFDLRGLAGVTIGTSLHEPVMHRTSPNHFQGCALAFARVRALGFARVGLVLTAAMNERVEGKWLGAFAACQQQVPGRERVGPLIADGADAATLADWLRREQPDAVLVAEELPWPAGGRRSDKALGCPPLAWLLRQGDSTDLGGLDYRPEQLGRVAVEMVVAQIHRNERGSPPSPQTVLIDAIWVDPPAAARSSPKARS